MVVARGKLNAMSEDVKTRRKIKFLDNDTEVNDIDYHTAEEEEPDNESSHPDDSDSYSDSDEAPEEESTSGIRGEILAKQKEELKTQQELKKIEKEKRRQQNIYNQQQKLIKKSKKHEQEEMPKYLPEEIFESIANNEVDDSESMIPSKHLKLQDFDKFDEIEIHKKIKESKLKEIKQNKKLSIKKGPVHVKVQLFNLEKKIVPKFENKVVNSRNKWLKRKSLGKK